MRGHLTLNKFGSTSVWKFVTVLEKYEKERFRADP